MNVGDECGERRRWRATIVAALVGMSAVGLGGCGAAPTQDTASDPGTTTAGSVTTTTAGSVTTTTAGSVTSPDARWPWHGGARLDVPAFRDATAVPGTVVLDVRTPEEFATGHLAGAVLADVNAPDFATRVAALDRTRAHAVYCRSGNRSQVAVEALRRAGITQVVELDGGILAWTASGGQTTTAR